MGQELAGVRLELERQQAASGVQFPVEFEALGTGPEVAGASMAKLLANGGVDGVLLLGVAGALAPGLDTGDLLLAQLYKMDSQAGSGTQLPAILPDANLFRLAGQAAATAGMPHDDSGSITADHLVSQPKERQALRESYGTDSVNMEDYRVAEAAQQAGVPFLAARVVLDTARQRLPGYLPGLAKSKYAVFTKVLAMPWRIPTLVRLKNQLGLCQSVLSAFGIAYVNVLAENGLLGRSAPVEDSSRTYGR